MSERDPKEKKKEEERRLSILRDSPKHRGSIAYPYDKKIVGDTPENKKLVEKLQHKGSGYMLSGSWKMKRDGPRTYGFIKRPETPKPEEEEDISDILGDDPTPKGRAAIRRKQLAAEKKAARED